MSDPHTFLADGLTAKTIRCSYNYCGLCGRVPNGNEEPNYAPLRWWDADDGWKITALCPWCFRDTFERKPKEGDYAFKSTNGVADEVNTDEDPIAAMNL